MGFNSVFKGLTGREFHVAVVRGREEGGLELNAEETKY